MTKEWKTFTGLKVDKQTGIPSDFFIFSNNKTLKIDVEEARDMFPKAVTKLEQTAFFYMIYGKREEL